MDAIKNAAFVSIGRACGFAGLAIFCLMFGLSFDLVLAARTGGMLCLTVTMVLALYGLRARSRPYKRTELWIILPKEQRPPARFAQRVVGDTLRETYLRFARQTVLVAIGLLAISLLLQAVEVGLSVELGLS